MLLIFLFPHSVVQPVRHFASDRNSSKTVDWTTAQSHDEVCNRPFSDGVGVTVCTPKVYTCMKVYQQGAIMTDVKDKCGINSQKGGSRF